MPTKAQHRQRIDELGGTQPPSSSTLRELADTVAALETAIPVATPTGDRPAVQPARCTAGRPLFLSVVCRHCFIRGVTACPDEVA